VDLLQHKTTADSLEEIESIGFDPRQGSCWATALKVRSGVPSSDGASRRDPCPLPVRLHKQAQSASIGELAGRIPARGFTYGHDPP
jgi:hypothetical protein